MQRPRWLLLPALAGVVLVAGCGGSSGPPAVARSYAGALSPVEPKAVVTVAYPRQPVAVEGAEDVSGDLMGFGARVKLRWRATVERLDAKTARIMQLDNPRATAPVGRESAKPAAPLKAPAGRELVVVQLDSWTPDKAGRRPGDRRTSDAKVTVVVGEETVPVAPALDILDVLIVNAPKGAPVVLKLTEYGRTQSLDLRTGKPGADVIPEMTGPRDIKGNLDYTAESTVTNHGVTRPYKLHLTGSQGELQPYLKDGGWAAPGRQWLVVPISATSNGIPDREQSGWFWIHYDIDAAKSFTVVVGGQRLTARSASKLDLTMSLTGGDEGSTALVFDVPGGTTAATLHIELSGSMKAQWREGEFSTRWNKNPAAADVPLTAVPL